MTNQTKAGEVPYEHERRFFPELARLPFHLYRYNATEITQGYLEDASKSRIRHEVGNSCDIYTRTQKSGEGISRFEDEHEITKDEFDALWVSVKCSLVKNRYYIPVGDVVYQLNIFHGELETYVQVEVEFKTHEEAVAFIPPTWLEPEVTHDNRHGNYMLAKFGIPKD